MEDNVREIYLKDLNSYDSSYEVWDETKKEWTDIKTSCYNESFGFPSPEEAAGPITAITIKTNNKFVVFGCGDFDNNRSDVRYVKCDNEIDLIKRFINEWSGDYPDIITGWNIKFFDIPYLINRITKLLGEGWAKRISPWNEYYKRTIHRGMGKTEDAYVLIGIAQLDYIELYKRFSPGGSSQESYRLNHIANVEVGERKLSYEEYGNLHTLYRLNYQKFITYNIRDTELVGKIDDKLKLIELALTLAYDSKCNYEDVFTQVRMWDSIIYNHLLKKKIIVPPNQKNEKNEAYVGAYVKDPLVGMHNWIVSFDLTSLYPMLIQQYNISPDTIIESDNLTPDQKKILEQKITVDAMLDEKVDTSLLNECTLTPNGQLFCTSKQGFLSEIMEEMYEDRASYKKKAIEAKKELEKEKDPNKRDDIEKRIARYNNLQLAKKVSLNSSYGSIGNEFFRFFDVRQAAGITTAGQLAIRWIEKKLNEYMNKILKTKGKDYVIASDTDSIYLSLDDLVSQTIIIQKPDATTNEIIRFMDKICESKIQPFIDKSYIELARYVNAFAQKMIMKREALADRGIWVAKKRYVLNVYNNEGVEYAKPKLMVHGLEMIKSSTPSACREKLWEVIDIILKGTENDVIEFIKRFRELFNNSLPADIAFPRTVNGLQKFANDKSIFGKGCPIHVRGALAYNHLIQKNRLGKKYPLIKEGEKIKFLYLKEPNTAQSHVISFLHTLPPEFGLDKFIDYDAQYEKSFVDALKIILNSIGWKAEKVNSLENFFE